MCIISDSRKRSLGLILSFFEIRVSFFIKALSFFIRVISFGIVIVSLKIKDLLEDFNGLTSCEIITCVIRKKNPIFSNKTVLCSL